MEKQNNQQGYQNPFFSLKYQDSKPFIETAAAPVEYKGFLIYHRVKSYNPGGNVFDIVKDGVCVGMYAGLNGAKKAIDEKKVISPALAERQRA